MPRIDCPVHVVQHRRHLLMRQRRDVAKRLREAVQGLERVQREEREETCVVGSAAAKDLRVSVADVSVVIAFL